MRSLEDIQAGWPDRRRGTGHPDHDRHHEGSQDRRPEPGSPLSAGRAKGDQQAPGQGHRRRQDRKKSWQTLRPPWPEAKKIITQTSKPWSEFLTSLRGGHRQHPKPGRQTGFNFQQPAPGRDPGPNGPQAAGRTAGHTGTRPGSDHEKFKSGFGKSQGSDCKHQEIPVLSPFSAIPRPASGVKVQASDV